MPDRTPTPSSADPRLAVDGLTVAFGGLVALDDVTFDVGHGETVALIGPNGAGKTTVFNAICGLVRRRAGAIRLDGRPAPRTSVGLTAAGVARTLQGLGLFDGMTVAEHLLVPLSRAPRAGGTRAGEASDRVAQVLDDLDLTAEAARRVDELPYPVRKRVALARALAARPSLLLLDEPAGGLGSDDIDALAAVVRKVAADGCSVLLVEHRVDFVMGLADRVVVLDFGRVIARGAPADVQTDPAVEAAYLGVTAAS
ncbi:ABC transporter ATP-binding protein [Agromyces larvae]|uniref:ATP-binding cassette domain-containing protein n=1 Tax=Agromyces larvae TaxID=2929802 RepID=A0ABY4BUG5_9MICO|nr:ATP-binding cassette domain-containing protein [Agromyces larvae]UOE42847.1 ATP-binding cassette domain-containing protein [Agromyces larvae]